MNIKTAEDEALPKMRDFIYRYGLRITLNTLLAALEEHNQTLPPSDKITDVLEQLIQTKNSYNTYQEK